MNRAIAQLCIFVGAVFILSGCGAPGTFGVTQSPSEEGQQPTTTVWKIELDESGSNPVIVDGVLYVGSADGAVYALDPKTGGAKWRFQTGESLSPVTSFPQVITVPRGTGIDDQMSAGMSAAQKQREQGIRRVDMTPAVENGTVFIGSGDRSFYAIDAATGKKKWSYVAGPGMASNNYTSYPVPAAVLKNGTVYFVTEDGLHALDALTGKRKWLFETLQEIPIENMNMRRKRTPSEPVLGDGVLFLTAWPPSLVDTRQARMSSLPRKSFVYAVDPESGKAKWVIGVDGLDITAPTTAKGLVFVAVKEQAQIGGSPSDREALYAINAADGQVKWKFGAASWYGTSQLLIVADTIYFSNNKSLFALELETGRELWGFGAGEINWNQINRNVQADDQHLYVATHKGTFARPKDTLHALALNTGQEKWSRGLSGNVRVAMIDEGVVYAGGHTTNYAFGRTTNYAGVYAIDAATGKELWSFKGMGRESARLLSGGRIFLTSPTVTYSGISRVDQGYLYTIDAKTGTLKP